jgi:hypothetical protein
MRQGNVLLASASILLTGLVFWLTAVTAENPHDDDSKYGISLARLSTFISLATSYLVRICHTTAQDPNFRGKFTYIAYLHQDLKFDFATNPQETYNLDSSVWRFANELHTKIRLTTRARCVHINKNYNISLDSSKMHPFQRIGDANKKGKK